MYLFFNGNNCLVCPNLADSPAARIIPAVGFLQDIRFSHSVFFLFSRMLSYGPYNFYCQNHGSKLITKFMNVLTGDYVF